MIHHNLRNNIRPYILIGLAIPLGIFIVVAGSQRMVPAENLLDRLFLLSDYVNGLDYKTVVSGLIVNFDSFRNSLYFFDEYDKVYSGFHYYEPFLDFILQPIPRLMMPDKPLLFSIEMTRQFLPTVYEDGASFDFGVIAESYYIFGPLGLIIMGLILGQLTRVIINIYDQKFNNISFIFLYLFVMFLPSYWFKGGMINSFANIASLMYIVPAIFLLKFLGK
jgi:hypothetical protein